jgi:homoserine dehydrogenase
MAARIIVLKFGSSVLGTRADVLDAVHEIYRWYRDGWQVVAVVSAIGRTTESLLAEAKELSNGQAQPDATAQLLATGERHSAALLGIALDRVGVRTTVVDPRDIGMIVSGSALDSELVAVDRDRVRALLAESPVIVIPGFFAYNDSGQLHLLGRGGSDLSAVFLARALQARCRLIKDVDGVYESDPATATTTTLRRFVTLGYADALLRAKQLVQAKAVHFIEQHGAAVEVASMASGYESTIGRCDCSLVDATHRAPLSVLILGLGTVGLGVYQRLAALPSQFRVIGVLVRDRAKHSADGVPAEILHESVDALSALQPHVVVDALPGLQPSQSLAHYYLAHGIAVVTANKALIATAGIELNELADRSGTSIRASAAVGGRTPMLESLEQLDARETIESIAGVLNGTCNYVLDRCIEGMDFATAVHTAQAHGFAEADPSDDLQGRDAGRKLQILACLAFGRPLDSLEIQPLDAATLQAAKDTLRAGSKLRMLARATLRDGRISGRIQLEQVHGADGFAGVINEWNRLTVTRANATDISVTGRGAGRWPTTEAVLADLFGLWRDASLAAKT